MIVPSIDIMDGRAVQLVEGRALEIDAGDPFPIAERFARVGEIAVIDLDAAMGRGDNAGLVEDLVRRFPCRVGGGIRSLESARRWLDRGARKIILGTAAEPELLRQLPRERVIAALDARDGEVVVEGWTKGTGAGVLQRLRALEPFVGGFLVTFVESEGRLGGLPASRVEPLLGAVESASLTVAGGLRDAAEIGALDARGVDVQVGMALYTGRLDLGDAVWSCVKPGRDDGLVPTVVSDETGVTLGLVWSSCESLRAALASGRGVYWSRSRQELWHKGETSGAVQELRAVDLDCDRDALRFTVRQAAPGFCHRETRSCFGDDRGLPSLVRRLAERRREAPAGSYTRRLLDDPALLRAKLIEEAEELARANDPASVRAEAADLLYFASVAMVRGGVSLDEVWNELDRRALVLTRRPGNAKSSLTREASA